MPYPMLSIPTSGSREVTLVSLKCMCDSEIQICPVLWTLGSSDRLCFKTTSPNDIRKFLDNPDGKCFLFPDVHMGPNLMCFLQDQETKELILLLLQSKYLRYLTPENWLCALDSVKPEFFFYMVRVCTRHPTLYSRTDPHCRPRTATGRNMPHQCIPIFRWTS